MTKEEYIKQQAEAKYTCPPSGFDYNKSKQIAFTSGAELMLEHMKGFVEWIVENGWSLTDYRDKEISPTWHTRNDEAPLTTSELIDLYFDQLPESK